MRFSAATLLVTALGWASAATAHTIQLKAHSRECFHETLHKDDLMTVTFQVGDREFGGSGNLEIDFWVRLPRSSALPLQLGLGVEDQTQGRRMSIAQSSLLGLFGELVLLIQSFIGRGPPEKPPVLQAGRLQRRLLLHRTRRRKVQLLFQQ